MKQDRDFWWHELMKDAPVSCEPEWMDAEDPLFILYTSGSTGKPKGVLHTTAGYLLYTTLTMKYVFDLKDEDVYWCTADIGWVTGHSYIVYGPPVRRGNLPDVRRRSQTIRKRTDSGRLWKNMASTSFIRLRPQSGP